jgi:hypothetical protein
MQGNRTFREGRWLLAVAAVLSMTLPNMAQAVPSFANQTGQNCVACHAGGQYPELTPYGRLFKLTGYTIGERAMPLSGMAVATYNRTTNTDTTTNPNGFPAGDFPKDGNAIFNTGSLFLAGKVTQNFGGFVQWTYNNYDAMDANGKWHGHSSSDNLDLRYVDRFISLDQDLIVGLTANNNPTVQDVWNSAPAWGYGTVPGSTQGGLPYTPMLAGGLSQQVAGVGAYAYLNKNWYAEISTYRTANGPWAFMSQGFSLERGDRTIVKGYNPYWRLAYTRDIGAHNIMLGASGMVADVYDDPANPSGPTTHHFRDWSLDSQYQYILDPHTVTAQVSFIKEQHRYPDSIAGQPGPVDAELGNAAGTVQAATNASDSLNMLRAKAMYVYRAKYGGSLSFFNVTGSNNSLNQTSAYDPVSAAQVTDPGAGGATLNSSGNPGTRGWTYEAFWTPVQYARIGVQYTRFDKFNGASSNYDGFGRSAKDNNTMFVYLWAAY